MAIKSLTISALAVLLSVGLFAAGCDQVNFGSRSSDSKGRGLTEAEQERADRLLEAVLAAKEQPQSRPVRPAAQPSNRQGDTHLTPMPGVNVTLHADSRPEPKQPTIYPKPTGGPGMADPDQFEVLGLEMLRVLGQIGRILATIDSHQAAVDAAPRLRQLAEQAVAIDAKVDQLGIADESYEDWFSQKHEPMIQTEIMPMISHSMRLHFTSAGPILDEALKPLESITK